jgi:hypothetical protein
LPCQYHRGSMLSTSSSPPYRCWSAQPWVWGVPTQEYVVGRRLMSLWFVVQTSKFCAKHANALIGGVWQGLSRPLDTSVSDSETIPRASARPHSSLPLLRHNYSVLSLQLRRLCRQTQAQQAQQAQRGHFFPFPHDTRYSPSAYQCLQRLLAHLESNRALKSQATVPVPQLQSPLSFVHVDLLFTLYDKRTDFHYPNTFVLRLPEISKLRDPS